MRRKDRAIQPEVKNAERKTGRMGGGRRAFTLIELLVVIAIIGILASFLLPTLFKVMVASRRSVASSEISSLMGAIASYESELGVFPRDPGNVFGADIPHYLFAALHNRPAFGGGLSGKSLNIRKGGIGILNGAKDFRAFHGVDGSVNPVNFAGADDLVLKVDPLREDQNPGTSAFQSSFDYGAAPAEINLDNTSGYPVFLDPWGNPYHYREWSLKARSGGGQSKEVWAGRGRPQDQRCHNIESFDIWSNGPDGVNNYGHPDSDDVTNW